MSLNGSGSYSAPAGGSYPASANTLIESGKFNTLIADMITALSTALYKDGQQVATARIPFAAGVQTDTVTEKTSDTGVTLDSVLLKDGRIDTTQGADIVCSATINLETATGNVVDVTGSTGPVTAITLSQGHWRIVRFTSTPTLTHGASLVLPGAANIVAAAGDYALFIGYATSVVRCALYFRAASITATLAGSEILTNKTITAPVLSGTATGTYTLGGTPTVSSTLTLSSGQLAFPATQSASADANTLDDYEEGTFTPSVGGTATYTIQTGRYTKIGRQVFINARLKINSIGSGSTGQITGIPFTIGTLDQAGHVGFFGSSATNYTFLSGYFASGTSTFELTSTAAAVATMTDPAIFFANNADVFFSGSYSV